MTALARTPSFLRRFRPTLSARAPVDESVEGGLHSSGGPARQPIALWSALAAGLVVASCTANVPSTSSPDGPTAEQLMAGILLQPAVLRSSFVGTGAFADLGIEQGIRLVKVRIVESLEIQVRIEAAHEVTFAEPPSVCLVGPYSAPDDAGLEDPCWGDPDLSASLAAQVPKDATGQAVLAAGLAIELSANLNRGMTRCDYPAGRWTVEFKGLPALASRASGGATDARPLWAPAVEFDVPLPTAKPLLYLKTDQTRYCGLATLVYQTQGEPEVVRQ